MLKIKNEVEQPEQKTTLELYGEMMNQCREIANEKHKQYGSSWRVMRISTLIDQIYIKLMRIRNIEESGGIRKVDDDILTDLKGIINYGYITTMQVRMEIQDNLPKGITKNSELSIDDFNIFYKELVDINTNLLTAKNHDYGEVWVYMDVTSFTDLSLTKIRRIKQMIAAYTSKDRSEDSNENRVEKNAFAVEVIANLFDIINYAFFYTQKI